MAEPNNGPILYRVAYSERVRDQLRTLADRASDRGMLQLFIDALKEFDRRLQIYPQFGDPLRDLQLQQAQLRIATVPPLVLRYVIDERNRQVFVVIPFGLLPNVGI